MGNKPRSWRICADTEPNSNRIRLGSNSEHHQNAVMQLLKILLVKLCCLGSWATVSRSLGVCGKCHIWLHCAALQIPFHAPKVSVRPILSCMTQERSFTICKRGTSRSPRLISFCIHWIAYPIEVNLTPSQSLQQPSCKLWNLTNRCIYRLPSWYGLGRGRWYPRPDSGELLHRYRMHPPFQIQVNPIHRATCICSFWFNQWCLGRDPKRSIEEQTYLLGFPKRRCQKYFRYQPIIYRAVSSRPSQCRAPNKRVPNKSCQFECQLVQYELRLLLAFLSKRI